MRIVLVGNFGLRPRGASLNGVAPKISNGMIRNGHYVFNIDDRLAARASSIFGSRDFGRRGANRALLDFCDHFGADALMLGHADVISADTVHLIRKRHPHMKVLQWSADPLFEADTVKRINSKLEVTDATFVTTAGDALEQFARPGHIVGYLPNPVDCAIERGQNFRDRDLPFDFLYAVGSRLPIRHHCGQVCDVEELGRRLVDQLPDVRFRFLGLAGRSNAAGIEYQRALESAKMGLNLSRRGDVFLYSSDRMAHLVGNGLLTLIDRATGFGDIFTEDELAFYSSEEELISKVRFFKENDDARRRVAESGWRKYHRIFGCEVIAKYLIDTLFGKRAPAKHGWPIEYTQ